LGEGLGVQALYVAAAWRAREHTGAAERAAAPVDGRQQFVEQRTFAAASRSIGVLSGAGRRMSMGFSAS
jgi:hypothetical protein